MARTRGASFRERGDKILVSVQTTLNRPARTERSFGCRATADAWADAAVAALNAGQPLPDADLFRIGRARKGRPAVAAGVPDFATVCWEWHREYYELQGRAQTERELSVAADLRRHVIPFFAAATTSIADLDTTTPAATGLVVEFLHHLAGTRPRAHDPSDVPVVAVGAVDIETAAELCGKSVSTVKRARAKGLLPNARRQGSARRLMIPVEDLVAAGLLANSSLHKGLAPSTAQDVLGRCGGCCATPGGMGGCMVIRPRGCDRSHPRGGMGAPQGPRGP